MMLLSIKASFSFKLIHPLINKSIKNSSFRSFSERIDETHLTCKSFHVGMTIITYSKTAVSNTTWIKLLNTPDWSTQQNNSPRVMWWCSYDFWQIAPILLYFQRLWRFRPTSQIYCQQWRDSTKTLGKIHKYKSLIKIMD